MSETANVHKVLSIDLDYIMFPCIKLYNQYSAGKENDTVIWKYISQEVDENYLFYDAYALQAILNKILTNVKNGAIFIPIREHDELVNKLHELEDFEDSTFDITNIDFHHDLFYDEEELNMIQSFNKYSCANWLGYLYFKDRIKSATWVKAQNSPWYREEIQSFPIEVKGLSDISGLGDDYEYVFLCLSPQWIPEKYQHLYGLICSAVDAIKE